MTDNGNKNKYLKILIIKSGCSYNRECEYNKGSLAVIITTSKTIRDFLPKSIISTNIQLSDKLSKKLNINVIKKKKVNTLRDYSIINSLTMTLNVIRCALWKFFDNLGFNFIFLKRNELIKAFEDAQVIVDISLDAYSDYYGTRHILEISKEIILAKLLEKPVMIYAQSVGPFRNYFNKIIAKSTLNNADLISVREEISYDYLIDAGIDKTPIYITADQAFLLEPESRENVNNILKKEFIKLKKPVVGIAISKMKEVKKTTSGRLKYLLYNWMIYLLPEFFTEKLMKFITTTKYFKNFESNIGFQWLEEVIEHLVNKYDASVLLVPHIISEQNEVFGDDRTTIKKIHKNLKSNKKDKVFPILGNYSSEELKGIIGQCDIFIGEKMHANVGALSQYIPTIGLSYSHKFKGIMRMLGQDEYVLKTTNSKIVIKKIDKLWNNQEKIKNELKEKMVKVRKKSYYNGELLKNLVSGKKILK